MRLMNLLVTGAAGFIGSHFVLRHSAARPQGTVTVLDLLTYASNKHYLDPVADAITFIEGDIADQPLVEKIIEDRAIDTIVNFAAESHVDNSISDATPFLHTNIIGTQSLIEAVKAHPSVRLLHISTDEVFGDIADGVSPCKVGDALAPSSPYAASKAGAEMLVLAAMRTFRIHACISRCTNNFGPHQADEKFIPTVIRKALRDEKIPVYGQGKNKRDWLFVEDHCDALEVILATPWAFFDPEVPGVHPSQPKGSGHTFHVSAGEERENIAVANMILDLLGKPHDLITFVLDRPGHDWRYALESSSTRALGWKPKVSFEEGLKRTVEWYTRENSKS